jgi:hypothetical protein
MRASVLTAPEAVRLVAELESEFARVREELSERQEGWSTQRRP